MKTNTRCFLSASAAAAIIAGLSTEASADISYALHAEGTAARMVGEGKVDQFGWGGGGLLAPEMTLTDWIGFELPVGGLVLSDGRVDEQGLAESGTGYGLFALPGVRLRPFGRRGHSGALTTAGLWLAGGAGLAYTGELVRAAFDARVGYDLFASENFRGGPSGGFLQIVETQSVARPQDARILMVGLHGAFEPVAPERNDDGDRDLDGIRDRIDGCPDDPEDLDGFEDLDGCPDNDNDRDGILDLDDQCPLTAEDKDGFEDENGCPDYDNDGDGILDEPDQCPLVAEDKDGFEDEDGCPDHDNDGDGILDANDKCPDEVETYNDYADDDGCPDTMLVRVVGDEIRLDDRVYFRVNLADVAPRSWPLLQNVAKLLDENPQYERVRIQGHADDTGEAAWNQALSERRGQAVREMLVKFGIDPDRLVAEGFGEDRPQLQDTSVHARKKNRRVEFLILQRGPAPKEDLPTSEPSKGDTQ